MRKEGRGREKEHISPGLHDEIVGGSAPKALATVDFTKMVLQQDFRVEIKFELY
jgi:hypothetical protein